MILEKHKYNYPPGRGMMSQTAHELRLDFFRSLAEIPEPITSTKITLEQVQNNIESFIGSTEIPMGLAGPLLFKTGKEKTEWVYTEYAQPKGHLLQA
jgi:hydroxymethylglutaryl-CoA reductase (NADPH)